MKGCPGCGAALAAVHGGDGMVFACNACDGRAIALAVLRKRHDQRFLTELWTAARSTNDAGRRNCPSCPRRMAEVAVEAEDGALPLRLDVCRGCYVVYFDAGEVEHVPRAAAAAKREAGELPQEVRMALAMAKVRAIQAEADRDRSLQDAADLRLVPGRHHDGVVGAVASLIGALFSAIF